MTPWQARGGTTRRRVGRRREPASVACLLALCLLPLPVQGLPGQEGLGGPGTTLCSTTGPHAAQSVPGPDDPDTVVRAAVALADQGELEAAGTILCDALHRWPEHPELLAALGGLRIRQGRPAEAEVLADRLIRVDPASDHGWEVLAASRYLQDDTRGALRAWSQRRPLVVRGMEVRVFGHDGPRTSGAGTDPTRLTGIAEGRRLTEGELVRGERRLGALPAASSARLGYHPLGGGYATIEGTVVLGATNPFTLPAMAAHTIRLLGGRIHLQSGDPLGRLERWELFGALEGTLRSVALVLAHPAPRGPGVWRWSVAHGTGRYTVAEGHQVVREEYSSVRWSQADWVTAWLLGSAHGQMDVRPGRGTFAGAGIGGSLVSLTGGRSLSAEGTGWLRVGGGPSDDGYPKESRAFGRLALRAALHPRDPPGVGGPSGVAIQGGLVAVSSGAPHDIRPRIGAGGNASLLMRARSDLDGEGVVRPLFPGNAWAHVSVELLRGVGSVGPVGIGVAAFADGVRALAPAPDPADPAARQGAVHLGVGVRARIPGVAGWLRADWAIDPQDGASRISAAWAPGRTS